MRVNSRFIGCTSGGVSVPCVLMFEYGLLDCTVLILLLFFSRCDCLLQTQPMAELADVVHRVQAVTFPMQSAIPAPASVNVRTDLSQRRGIFLVVSTITF